MDIYFLLGLNTNTTFFVYIFSDLSIGNSLDWFPCFPTSFFFFFSLLFAFWAFLTFWHYKCSLQPHLVYMSCPSSRTSHFAKEPWFLSLYHDTKNQDLGVRCVYWRWIFFFFFFFFATPAAFWSSWARDQTRTTAVTWAAAMTTPDP